MADGLAFRSRRLVSRPSGAPLILESAIASAVYVLFILNADVLVPFHDASEGAAMEWSQNVVLLASSLLAVALAMSPRRSVAVRVWASLFAGGLFLILGEEVSWGQHIFGWPTPEWLAGLNKEGETNLHNLATWPAERGLRVALTAGAPAFAVLSWVLPRLQFGRRLHLSEAAGADGALLPWALFSAAVAIQMKSAPFLPGQAGLTVFQYGEIQELFLYVMLLRHLIAMATGGPAGVHRLRHA